MALMLSKRIKIEMPNASEPHQDHALRPRNRAEHAANAECTYSRRPRQDRASYLHDGLMLGDRRTMLQN